jgi:hypothetical protein
VEVSLVGKAALVTPPPDNAGAIQLIPIEGR